MKKYHPDAVAHVAATLLAGRHDAERHHILKAVDTARAILDEVYAGEEMPGDGASAAGPSAE